MSQGHRSIGEVLAMLESDHPDLTISKIRFLESQGLISPQRTPSGYRKFFDPDIERLSWVLVQQRDHFLPLKEIKRRLAAGETPESGALAGAPGGAGVGAASAVPSLFAPSNRPDADGTDAAAAQTEEAGDPEGSVNLTVDELADATGVGADYIAELQRLGIVVTVSAGAGTAVGAVFDQEALQVVRIAAALAAHGVPARNLRMFKVAADREAGVYEQLLGSLIARGDTARLQAELTDIVDLTELLHRLLLRRLLRPNFG